MKKLLLPIVVFALGMAHGQNTVALFKLNGTINSKSGQMLLIPIGDTAYYSSITGPLEVEVTNGRFVFQGTIPHPFGFQIGLKVDNRWKYISAIFIVEPTEQTIVCNVDSLREHPKLFNHELIESKVGFLKAMDEPGQQTNTDTALFYYAKTHPNSFSVFWRLVKQFSYGYKAIYDSTYDALSDSIKNTHAGITLTQKLTSSRLTLPGNFFPPLLISKGQKITKKTFADFSTPFTLVDFWFSGCRPCIEQFIELKKMLNTYKGGFNILAISVDREKDEKEWKRIIRQYKLPWEQYIDWNGKEAERLGIKTFPSNFLLNKKGLIIAKDVEPNQLNEFLEKARAGH